MAQEYKLTSFEPSDFKDTNNNYWCTATFEDVGEPVRWVVRDPSKVKVGESFYGEINDWTSSTGKVWPRFYRKDKPEAPQSHQNSGKTEYHGADQDAIRAQWAIGQAVSAHAAMNGSEVMNIADFGSIESYAKELYKMVSRVKDSDKKDAVAELGGEPFNLDDIPL